jgi:hypothetical protein
MPDETPEPNGPNYRGNSYTSKSKAAEKKDVVEKPKLEQVTGTVAIERKKSLGTKMKETFTGDDMSSVVQWVALEVVVPAIKTLISDMASQGVERLLFGGAAPRSGRRNVVQYNKMSSGNSSSGGRPQMSSRARAAHDFREIILPDRGEAELTLENLQAQIDEYGMATVEDLYSLVGITGTFMDSQWGWTDLRGSGIKRVREGYLLELPRTTSLD